DLPNYRADWERLLAGSPFGSFGSSYEITHETWLHMLATQDRMFGYDKKPLVIIGKGGGKVVFIAPLALVKRARSFFGIPLVFSCIQFMAQSFNRQFRLMNTIIAEPEYPGAWSEALAWIKKEFSYDLLHLDFIPESCAFITPGSPELFHSAT